MASPLFCMHFYKRFTAAYSRLLSWLLVFAVGVLLLWKLRRIVALVVIAASVMLQGETPPELRGRVSGAAASLMSLSQLAAMLLSGWWAARLGIRGVFLVSAAMLFAIGGSGFKRCGLSTVRLH